MNLRFVFSAFLLLSLSACAFPDNRDEIDNRAQRDYEVAQTRLRPILGIWSGVLHRGTQIIGIEMTIESTPAPTGNSTGTGQPILRAEPRATLRSTTDARYPDQSFVGVYHDDTGNLLLTSQDRLQRGQTGAPQPAASPDDLTSMNLTYNGTTLRGELRASGGIVGVLELTKYADLNSGNEQDSEDRYNALLRRQYEGIVGNFYGNVVEGVSSDKKTFGVCLNFFVTDTATSSGRFRPVLKAFYRRYDVSTDSLRRTLSVTYNINAIPSTVFMTSAAPGAPGGGSGGGTYTPYTVEISARFADRNDQSNLDELNGTHTNVNLGQTGVMTLKRTSNCPPPPQPGGPNRPKPPGQVKPPGKKPCTGRKCPRN